MRLWWWWPCLAALCLAANDSKEEEDQGEQEKTLSQQIAEGKYGLIQKELYATAPSRPGILSYSGNPEVPKDTADTLGGLDSREIWLAENHVLVLSGGGFSARGGGNRSAWPPIDAYQAPPRQVKIPPRPKVPPPFPVQLKDGEPPSFIGPNGTTLPLPPGSYFAPPFPLPPPPGNYPPPPAYNGSSSPPPPPYPPPANGSFFGQPLLPPPPSGNVSTGNGPYLPPPFPGLPPPPANGSPPPANGSLPPLFPHLPPGAAILPPPDNLTDLYDEDDPSIYYPPPYDFFYPRDNSTEVPPGPLVPGIILPPPPDFFAPLAPGGGTTTTTSTTEAPPTPTAVQRPPPSRPLRVEVTHGGQSPLHARPLYQDNLVEPPRQYDEAGPVSYHVAPLTDILVRFNTLPPPPPPLERRPKPPAPSQYYQLQRDIFPSEPLYVLEYDSSTARPVPLVAAYFSPTARPKASFYFYEERATSRPRYYRPPARLTAAEQQEYVLQRPQPDHYWASTSRPDYSYDYRPETTPSSLLLHYTRHDQGLIDDITKKYFTMFGQRLGAATTPLPPPPPRRRPAPVPLHGDTLVNYRRPLPPVEPDSELIQQGTPGAEASLVSYQLPGSGGAHVYFLTPRLSPRREKHHEKPQGYLYSTPSPEVQLRYRRRGGQHA